MLVIHQDNINSSFCRYANAYLFFKPLIEKKCFSLAGMPKLFMFKAVQKQFCLT